MVKAIMLVVVLALVTGCKLNAPSRQFEDFVSKYGSSSRYYCNDDGFLVYEYFYMSDRTYTSKNLVVNDLDQPVRCGKVSKIDVIDTSLGTKRVF